MPAPAILPTRRARYALEAHAHAATLHLRGELTPRLACGAIDACEMLPAGTRTLVVDLRGITLVDAHGLATLHRLLRRWRGARGGTIRVLPPARRAA